MAVLVDEEYVAYLTRLTKSSNSVLREQAYAELMKAGPKGYEHGWHFVGVPVVGSLVQHPTHGHGRVVRAGKKTSAVKFTSGHESAFEHGAAGPSDMHFVSRAGSNMAKKRPVTNSEHRLAADAQVQTDRMGPAPKPRAERPVPTTEHDTAIRDAARRYQAGEISADELAATAAEQGRLRQEAQDQAAGRGGGDTVYRTGEAGRLVQEVRPAASPVPAEAPHVGAAPETLGTSNADRRIKDAEARAKVTADRLARAQAKFDAAGHDPKVDALREHFPLGVGGSGGGRRGSSDAQLSRYVEARKARDAAHSQHIRAEAQLKELTARQGAAGKYSRDTVAAGDAIKVGGTWWPVKKANGKTVQVDAGPGMDLKYRWEQVTDHRSKTKTEAPDVPKPAEAEPARKPWAHRSAEHDTRVAAARAEFDRAQAAESGHYLTMRAKHGRDASKWPAGPDLEALSAASRERDAANSKLQDALAYSREDAEQIAEETPKAKAILDRAKANGWAIRVSPSGPDGESPGIYIEMADPATMNRYNVSFTPGKRGGQRFSSGLMNEPGNGRGGWRNGTLSQIHTAVHGEASPEAPTVPVPAPPPAVTGIHSPSPPEVLRIPEPSPERRAQFDRIIADYAPRYQRFGTMNLSTSDTARYLVEGHIKDATSQEWDWIAQHLRDNPHLRAGNALTDTEITTRNKTQADELSTRAFAAFDSGNPQEALRLIDQAQQIDPRNRTDWSGPDNKWDTIRRVIRERMDEQGQKYAAADLVKVGPKGYIHGWILVGAPGVGKKVRHKEHGSGIVIRSGKKTSTVRFDSGAEHAFEHGAEGGGRKHFADRKATKPVKPAKFGQTAPPTRSPDERRITAQAEIHTRLAAASVDQLTDAFRHISTRPSSPGQIKALREIDAELARREGVPDLRVDDDPYSRKMDDLISRGRSYADAYAEVRGLDPARLNHQERTALVDAERRPGERREQTLRRMYAEHVAMSYVQAEAQTRGNVLTAEGRAKGVDPMSLWSGQTARARKYASDELKQHWESTGGRLTWTQFRAQYDVRGRGAAEASRLAGSGRDFGV